MDLKQLGFRIKVLRKKKKLTQDELSERAEMNSKHLGEVERGLINISIQNLDKIADALDEPLASFFDVSHQREKKVLCKEIEKILKEASSEQVQQIYRIIKDIVT